ncbi:biotin transporter BioY [Oscillospiraceae bacterium LTW-04]|nr:biotin transporter BioY [Oscillospiraceae bacterium MB24-C1]
MSTKKLSVRDLCFIGIFTAVIVVLAQISIPMPYGVPMTLQTFAIPLAGIVLGARKGALSTLTYILLGAFGVPVFAGFTGGLGIVFGPTGGFILSFPLMALAAGIGSECNNNTGLVCGLIAGAVINYICGMLMFSLVTSRSLTTAFVACVLPFIPTSIIKMVLAAILGVKVKHVLEKEMMPA